jgi:ATP-dependent protease ClpP protease subunit
MYRFLSDIVEGASAAFAAFLDTLAAEEAYGIEVNSPGGSVNEGMFISHRMARRPPAVAYIHSAGSMAALLAQHAANRVMAADGHLTPHNPNIVAQGDSDKLKQTAGWMKEIEDEMVSIYRSRSKATKSDILEMMKAEHPLNAKQAKECGFIDEFVPAGQMAALVASQTQAKESSMDIRKLLAKLLRLPEDSVKVDDKGVPTAETSALLEAKAALLDVREQELTASAEKSLRAQVIADAVKAGKLTEATAKLEALTKLDAATLKTLVDSLPAAVPLARADLTNLAAADGATQYTAAQLTALAALGVDPKKAATVSIPAEGAFRYTATAASKN